MRSVVAIAGVIAVIGLSAFAGPESRVPAKPAQVMVHCPSGSHAAYVTPKSLTIHLGESVAWMMTGQVTSDSLIIALKNPKQAWPFAGTPPRGGHSAQADSAHTKGTYMYSVSLRCRMPGGHTQPVTIDPAIIIE